VLDQSRPDDHTFAIPAGSKAGVAGGDVSKQQQQQQQQQLVWRASKALLKQVEETRRKYTAEVEGLKAELQLLNKQARKDRRDADLASVTAAAAKKAALEATEELERLNDDVLRSKRALQQLNRSANPVDAGVCWWAGWSPAAVQQPGSSCTLDWMLRLMSCASVADHAVAT